ncbi:hypothetical protein [Camelimonas lactis]|uniref:Uncharacterized protein n=1 Tax=Camelimonas lactis TaxID=659006 RepID=A0A4R2GW54_9HYPH|nr:hypothetical protein [Camelimonas lactis]TCO15229.1 hypothetical protein EV666_102207 [Camelimonas lactis]
MSIWPPIIYLALMTFNLISFAVLNGQPRSPYSFHDAFTSMLMVCGLLYWGGFFEPLLRR